MVKGRSVVVKADLAAVYMYGNRHIQLDEMQIDQIKKTIQPLLNDFNIILHPKMNNRWYLQLTEKPLIKSIDPNAIVAETSWIFCRKI